MTLRLLLEALGGLGIFILGMRTMAEGMQRLASPRLRQLLDQAGGNLLTAPLLGGLMAFLLQSAGAAGIFTASMTSAGLLSLYQALLFLTGTSLGTLASVQILAYRPPSLALPAILLGVVLTLSSQRRRRVYAGKLILGAGLLFLGLDIVERRGLSLNHDPLTMLDQVQRFGIAPALLAGIALTLLLQSGRISLLSIIALATAKVIGPLTILGMLVGEGVGSALLAAIGAIGASLAAKRALFANLILRALFALVAAGATPLLIIPFSRALEGNGPQAILWWYAGLVGSYLCITLPLAGIIGRLAERCLFTRSRGHALETRTRHLDDRILDTPSLALAQARLEMARMADTLLILYRDTVAQFHRYTTKRTTTIQLAEELLDHLQQEITAFLLALSRQPVGSNLAAELPRLLLTVDTLERIGDQANALLGFLRRKKESRLLFSDQAMQELRLVADAVNDLLGQILPHVIDGSNPDRDRLEGGRAAITALIATSRGNHLRRLREGRCSVAPGIIFDDMLTAFATINDLVGRLVVPVEDVDV